MQTAVSCSHTSFNFMFSKDNMSMPSKIVFRSNKTGFTEYYLIRELCTWGCVVMSRGQVLLWHRSVLRSHLLGVIVEDSDGALLGPDAAGLCVGCAAVLVWSLLELIGNGHISDRRWPSLYHHVRQEPRVQQEAPNCHDQTHQEDDNQGYQQEISHGFSKW